MEWKENLKGRKNLFLFPAWLLCRGEAFFRAQLSSVPTPSAYTAITQISVLYYYASYIIGILYRTCTMHVTWVVETAADAASVFFLLFLLCFYYYFLCLSLQFGGILCVTHAWLRLATESASMLCYVALCVCVCCGSDEQERSALVCVCRSWGNGANDLSYLEILIHMHDCNAITATTRNTKKKSKNNNNTQAAGKGSFGFLCMAFASCLLNIHSYTPYID